MPEDEDDGFNIPGPVPWDQASHWIEYDHEAKTVETWAKLGPDYRFKMRTRCRPMVGLEIILSDMRDRPKDDIRAACDAYWAEIYPVPIVTSSLNRFERIMLVVKTFLHRLSWKGQAV